MKLLMLKGLPASGKTTHAMELVVGGWRRVNKDEIRTELFPNYKLKDEKYVIQKEDEAIIIHLMNGCNVVVDDTNLNPKHQERLEKIAAKYGAEFEVLFIDTHIEECIKRNNKRQKHVPLHVIIDMYNRYIAPLREDKVEYDDNLEECILVDVDGTLAHINDRHVYDASRALEDSLDDAVGNIVNMAYGHGYKVVILTGRDGAHLQVTKDWLEKVGVNYDEIYSREAGDRRPDYEVKRELFESHIRNRYNVKYVIDDRPQVCRMWRSIGLTTLQVGDPHHEF